MTVVRVATPTVTHIRAAVRATRTDVHDIGWLPGDGWFCTTCANARCRLIGTVRAVIESEETT